MCCFIRSSVINGKTKNVNFDGVIDKTKFQDR